MHAIWKDGLFHLHVINGNCAFFQLDSFEWIHFQPKIEIQSFNLNLFAMFAIIDCILRWIYFLISLQVQCFISKLKLQRLWKFNRSWTSFQITFILSSINLSYWIAWNRFQFNDWKLDRWNWIPRYVCCITWSCFGQCDILLSK